MRLTLRLDPRRPWRDLVVLAGHAERAGWDGVRIGDDPGGQECWAVMGALATAVPRVRLEAVVRDDAGRHPAVVAKLASTVDQLSGGRLLLGFEPAAGAEGEARLAEGVRVVKSLAGGDRTSWRGRYYQLQDAPMDPKPVQQPFPVMVVGGSSELATRCADHWGIPGPPQEVGGRLAALEEACRRTGRDRREIELSTSVDDPARIGELAADATANAFLRVDGWVVADAAVGDDPAVWAQMLVGIRTATER